jgi:uncharacterized membrane protein YkvA (DUF1232 family)
VRLLDQMKARARELTRELHALYLACRDPRTPWYARVLAAIVLGYAFSPIDLIPDFIPIFGYLDDLVLLPLGIWTLLRLIPGDVMRECRQRAGDDQARRTPASRVAAAVIVLVWLALLACAAWAAWQRWGSEWLAHG